MPAAFIGHGNPLNALESNRFTQAWSEFGRSVPAPRAVVCVSAHWYTNVTALTAMARPRTIHDFFGFPDELFAFDYPAPGSLEVAQQVVDTLAPRWAGLDLDSWGLDHGTWSILAHMYPDADVPVVQLSVNALEPLEYHFEIGTRLTPLLDLGILIIASGNVVHNLRHLEWRSPDRGADWARRFDDATRGVMTTSPGKALSLQEHPDFALAVPTPDHFIPLLHIAGLAAAAGAQAEPFAEGCIYGSLSMTSYRLPPGKPA